MQNFGEIDNHKKSPTQLSIGDFIEYEPDFLIPQFFSNLF